MKGYLSDNSCFDDPHILHGAIFVVCLHPLYAFHHLQTFYYFAENGVLAV